MTDIKFTGVEIDLEVGDKDYNIQVAGPPGSDINMIDAKGDGQYFVISDGQRPLALVVNSDLMNFRGFVEADE